MIKSSKLYSIFFFLILWQLLAVVLKSDVFPSVVDISISLYDHLIDGELIKHLSITLYRVFITFVITMIVGIIIGIFMGISQKINDMFDFVLIIALNIPALVTIVICYIWFGLTDLAAIVAVIVNKLPIVIVNIREGTRNINKKYLQLGEVYKVEKKEIFSKLFLPQIYPYMLASTRLTLALIWKIVLVVELLGRSDGVGFAISMYFQYFDITSIMAYSIAFILVVLVIEYFILNKIENRINRWK